jgi:hypothetical protein
MIDLSVQQDITRKLVQNKDFMIEKRNLKLDIKRSQVESYNNKNGDLLRYEENLV